MAVYRHVHIEFWQDGFVLDLTPEEKYFYMYLMTNSKTSQCGIYELPKRIMETETGYNRETVEKLILRFEDYGKILYCEETREVFLLNWMKHNRANSPKVKKCIEKELVKVKNKDFVDKFLDICKDIDYSIDTVSIVYGEKEKEKQKEKEKKEEKEKEEEPTDSVGRFKKLYEQNIGLINGIVAEWLFEISELIDYELFKRAIEIATDKGKCNKGYVSGIIKQWLDNNIRSYEDLKAYEIGVKNRREESGEYSQYKYANANERENEDIIYRAPSKEQLEEIRNLIGQSSNI